MSQDQSPPPDRTPGGGRPPGGSGRRRRRGRGRGGSGGAGGADGGSAKPNAPAAGSPPLSGAPRPSNSGNRSGRGSSGRGSGRGSGSGGRSGGGGGGERGGRRPPPAQPQPAAVRELEITDDKIFQRLLDAGLDLGQEAVIEAFLYFTGEGSARRVAGQLEEGGYRTYVDPNPPGRWLLEAVSRAVPTPEHIAGMSSSLRSAASSNNGIYDGWWASEPPEEEESGLVGVALEEDPQGGQEDDLQVQPD